ncbi:MAG: Lar family restriction alleviation protein [Lactobacillales bacterium]|nr:Lar family restriction alleviation protein [Lactobacillales bacterium]
MTESKKLGNKPKLLSCPFCGGTPEPFFLDGFPNLFYIWCPKCGVHSHNYKTIQGAARWWNKRKGEEKI